MIKIVETKTPKRKRKPHYLLVYDYMIGDDDGNTSETVKLSVDNPHIERYVTLLNSLEPTEGTWGLMLNSNNMGKCLDEKQITKDDYNFLMRLMFPERFDIDDDSEATNYFKTDKDNKFADEFYEGVNAETEYSFLTFEGVTLYYVDENGVKKKTKILKGKQKSQKK